MWHIKQSSNHTLNERAQHVIESVGYKNKSVIDLGSDVGLSESPVVRSKACTPTKIHCQPLKARGSIDGAVLTMIFELPYSWVWTSDTLTRPFYVLASHYVTRISLHLTEIVWTSLTVMYKGLSHFLPRGIKQCRGYEDVVWLESVLGRNAHALAPSENFYIPPHESNTPFNIYLQP